MAVNFGHILQGTMTLLGRISLCAIFLSSAIGFNLPNFEDAISAMAHEGVPMPRVALVLAIGSLLAGSLMVIIGWPPVGQRSKRRHQGRDRQDC